MAEQQPDPSERTAVFHRSVTRGIAGVVALGLVAVLEIARRHTESPPPQEAPGERPLPAATVPVAPTLPPIPRKPPPATPRAALAARPAEPKEDESPAPTQLEIDVQHGIKSGTLAVYVDDEPIIEDALHSRVTGKVLTIERRRGRFREAFEVSAGVHRVRVVIRWDDHERDRTASATFQEGRTRRLVARIKGLTRSLDLEWR